MKNRLNRRRFLKGAASLPILAASRARADNLLGLIGDGLWNPSYLTGICGAWSVNQVILNGSTVAAIKPYGPYWMTNAEGNPTGSTTLPALSGGRIVFDATRTFLESNEVT